MSIKNIENGLNMTSEFLEWFATVDQEAVGEELAELAWNGSDC